MNMSTAVDVRGVPYVISCVARESNSPAERLIEPEFYLKGGGSPPQGKHYELELVTPVWQDVNAKLIHFHRSDRNGKNYVCWTGQLPTIKAAQGLFEVWCAGTAYTMATGNDFIPLFKGSGEEFLRLLETEHGVRVLV